MGQRWDAPAADDIGRPVYPPPRSASAYAKPFGDFFVRAPMVVEQQPGVLCERRQTIEPFLHLPLFVGQWRVVYIGCWAESLFIGQGAASNRDARIAVWIVPIWCDPVGKPFFKGPPSRIADLALHAVKSASQ